MPRIRSCRIQNVNNSASSWLETRWFSRTGHRHREHACYRHQPGRYQECEALRAVFGTSDKTLINNTKSFIGHAMGAAGALELAGNLPSFADKMCHPTINVTDLDPECALPGWCSANRGRSNRQTTF